MQITLMNFAMGVYALDMVYGGSGWALCVSLLTQSWCRQPLRSFNKIVNVIFYRDVNLQIKHQKNII